MPPRRPERLLALLEAHEPADDRERADRARMLAFAARLPEPFSRAQPEAHFTGSAVVVDPAGERTVLLHHARLGRWLQPGGHAETADEGDMARTALREAREETGCTIRLHDSAPGPIDLDVHVIPARGEEPEHLHLDVRFLVVATDPAALAHDPGESFGARWLGWEEALASVDDGALRRLLGKARARAGRPVTDSSPSIRTPGRSRGRGSRT